MAAVNRRRELENFTENHDETLRVENRDISTYRPKVGCHRSPRRWLTLSPGVPRAFRRARARRDTDTQTHVDAEPREGRGGAARVDQTSHVHVGLRGVTFGVRALAHLFKQRCVIDGKCCAQKSHYPSIASQRMRYGFVSSVFASRDRWGHTQATQAVRLL